MTEFLIEVMRTPEKYLSWRWSSPVFFLTSCLIFVAKNLSIGIILSPMITIIKIFWLISALVIIYSTIVYAFRLGVKLPEGRQEKITAERSAKELDAFILKEITELSPSEKSLLKYVYNNSSDGVYIPYENPAGLSLLKKGILRLYSRMTTMRGIKYSDSPDQCLLYGIVPHVRDVLKVQITQWNDVRIDTSLDDYQ